MKAIPQSTLAICEGIGTYQCIAFRENIFNKHYTLSRTMAYRYKAIAKEQGYVKANQFLLHISEHLQLGKTGLHADCSDDEFTKYAEIKSKTLQLDIHDFTFKMGQKSAIVKASSDVEKAGLEFPLKIKTDDSPETIKRKTDAALARVSDAQWWLRKIRRQAAKKLEHVCRLLGMVCRKRSAYVSNNTLTRRREQKARNRRILETLIAENDAGYSASLADIAALGIANPVNRRNELMTRISGFEEIAKSMNLVGLFLTITAPSKFHAIKENGHHNPKYNGATPNEAQAYLNKVWQLTRSKWHRNAIRVFGFRFVEPHHDGTPHWHMLVFVPTDKMQKAIDIYREHATAEDLEELNGDYKKRFDHILIDWSKGSAAGYVAKYVSKNIDGFKVAQDDESGDCALSSAERVEAWASTWGIRQFQQIGSTSVTVWRELRRGANNGAFSNLSEEAFMTIVNAADEGNWALFVELMGGALTERNKQAIRVLHVLSDKENRYGEYFKKLQGVIMRGVSRITRPHKWSIKNAMQEVNEDFEFESAVKRRALDLCK